MFHLTNTALRVSNAMICSIIEFVESLSKHWPEVAVITLQLRQAGLCGAVWGLWVWGHPQLLPGTAQHCTSCLSPVPCVSDKYVS